MLWPSDSGEDFLKTSWIFAIISPWKKAESFIWTNNEKQKYEKQKLFVFLIPSFRGFFSCYFAVSNYHAKISL